MTHPSRPTSPQCRAGSATWDLWLDALVVSTVPDVQKAVRWNSPFYGVEGQGWFLSYHCFTKYVKVTFFRGTSLRPAAAWRIHERGDALPRCLQQSGPTTSSSRALDQASRGDPPLVSGRKRRDKRQQSWR